jgi:hypothetical protein
MFAKYFYNKKQQFCGGSLNSRVQELCNFGFFDTLSRLFQKLYFRVLSRGRGVTFWRLKGQAEIKKIM